MTTSYTPLLLLTTLLLLLLLSPSLAQKQRYRYETARSERLREEVGGADDLALRIGFHSGCSGCLAAPFNYNWCVHPDNTGVGACINGPCSSVTYDLLFPYEENTILPRGEKRQLSFEETPYVDGNDVCTGREKSFRVRNGEYKVYGVQDEDNWETTTTGWSSWSPYGFRSAISHFTDGAYYNTAETFSRSVRANFCNIPGDGVLIDRTAGGPDQFLNAGYEHCMIANSEARQFTEFECGIESECYEPYYYYKRNVDSSESDSESHNEDNAITEKRQFPERFTTGRFFHYQCEAIYKDQEERDHYYYVIDAIRSAMCDMDCNPYGVPLSGICQSTCDRINDAYSVYYRAFGDNYGSKSLDSFFRQVGQNQFEWIDSAARCVPDNTPYCRDVSLEHAITDYYRYSVSPESLTEEEFWYCYD